MMDYYWRGRITRLLHHEQLPLMKPVGQRLLRRTGMIVFPLVVSCPLLRKSLSLKRMCGRSSRKPASTVMGKVERGKGSWICAWFA